jgi:hypothetical protein
MKKILALILALVMLASCFLTSCIDESDNAPDSSDNQNGGDLGELENDKEQEDMTQGDKTPDASVGENGEESNTETDKETGDNDSEGEKDGTSSGVGGGKDEGGEDENETENENGNGNTQNKPSENDPTEKPEQTGPSWDDMPMYPIENAVPSSGLKFTKNKDGQSYSLAGMGTCRDNIIVVPYEYLGLPVTKVAFRAFEGDVITNEITLPKTVKVIGDNAFSMMKGLRKVNLSEGLEVIEHEAFCGCSMISQMKLPSTVKEIGAMAFAGCNFTSFEWPRVIPTMTVNVFLDCASLETVFIPSTVTKIQPAVFNYCRSLTRIEFEGTMEQWNNLPKGDEWDGRTPDYIIVCSDGTLNKSN